MRGAIDVDGVSFCLRQTRCSDNVFAAASSSSGEMVAIVSTVRRRQESTLCKLILRFYDAARAQSGSTGRDVCAVTQGVAHRRRRRRAAGGLSFADTIGNIRYGKPDATQAEIEAAAKKAEIYDDIMAMPDGF